MGFRFRKRVKLFSGVWLNLSKSGVSTSIGGKGVTVNIKDDKIKTTASLIGSGLSYSDTVKNSSEVQKTEKASSHFWLWLMLIVAGVVLLSLYI